MKKTILFLLLLPLFSGVSFSDELEIVESAPEETVYGSTMTSRPGPVWLEMISKAEKSLDFEEFYVENLEGEILDGVIKEIKKKAESGVKTRFVFERVMLRASAKSLGTLKGKNIEVRIVDFKKLSKGVQHAKFFIMDGKEVYIGSQNFDWRSLSQIHELGVRIKSERAAKNFLRIFEDDWAFAGDASRKPPLSAQAEPLNSKGKAQASLNGKEVRYYLAFSPKKNLPKNLESEIDELLKLIKGAKKSVKAQVMSYSMKSVKWRELHEALRKAGKRGVSVSLVFADWTMGGKNDKAIKELGSSKNVSVKISSIPPHSRGFIPFARVQHCKFLVADGRKGMISTSNWGYDYFYQSRGAAVILEGEEAGKILEDVFDRSWNAPYASPLDQEKIYEKVKRE